jgi:hypothetical protein
MAISYQNFKFNEITMKYWGVRKVSETIRAGERIKKPSTIYGTQNNKFDSGVSSPCISENNVEQPMNLSSIPPIEIDKSSQKRWNKGMFPQERESSVIEKAYSIWIFLSDRPMKSQF